MRTVHLVTFGGATPMGQQAYETQLQAALERSADTQWLVTTRNVMPLRAGGGTNTLNLPLRPLWRVPHAVAAAIGPSLYGRHDIVHRLDLRCPPSGGREVLTIHDLPPLRFADEGRLPSWAGRTARKAAAVICPSEFAAQEVRDLLHVSRVHVIPYGIDGGRAAAAPFSPRELGGLGLARPLVLHAAGATTRKNLALLADAWPYVRSVYPDACLALCGPPSDRRHELFDATPGARILGHRAPEFVAKLMKTADAVVVPSSYEGFGLPLLEAMLAGTPAVASAAGALPEVAGDAAILVAPRAEDFAAGICKALEGGPEIEVLREAGRARASCFTWDRCVSSTVAVYEKVVE